MALMALRVTSPQNYTTLAYWAFDEICNTLSHQQPNGTCTIQATGSASLHQSLEERDDLSLLLHVGNPGTAVGYSRRCYISGSTACNSQSDSESDSFMQPTQNSIGSQSNNNMHPRLALLS